MSANIDVVRVRDEPESGGSAERPSESTAGLQSATTPEPAAPSSRRVFEVSDVDADELRAYARSTDARELYLERKGGHTFLVSE